MLDRDIYNQAIAAGMPASLASLITAQAKHESNNFSSRVFKIDNNLFGYKFVGQQGATKGLLSPEGDHYAHYDTVGGSVREICNWIKRRANKGEFPANLSTIQTPEQYASLLKKAGYYGAPLSEYTSGLKKFFKDYGAAISFGGVLLVAALAWILMR